MHFSSLMRRGEEEEVIFPKRTHTLSMYDMCGMACEKW